MDLFDRLFDNAFLACLGLAFIVLVPAMSTDDSKNILKRTAGFNLEVQHPRERPPLGLDNPDISWADC